MAARRAGTTTARARRIARRVTAIAVPAETSRSMTAAVAATVVRSATRIASHSADPVAMSARTIALAAGIVGSREIAMDVTTVGVRATTVCRTVTSA